FLSRAAILGTEAMHVGRGVHTAVVMSSTSSAEPFTGISTVAAPGMFGSGDVGVGAGVGATVGAVVRAVVGATVGCAATCGPQADIARRAGTAGPRTR